MTSHNHQTGAPFRIHNCSFAPVCPACQKEQPCPPLIVLAVLEHEASLLPHLDTASCTKWFSLNLRGAERRI